jgi:hypothetical protein
MEVLYALVGFGIMKDTLPAVMDGEYTLEDFRQQLEDYRRLEQAEKASSDGTIMVPLVNDILLGRGRPYQENPGNIRMANLIDEYRIEYQSKSKLQKTAMSNKVLQMIKTSDARFLKKSSESGRDYWVEVGDEVARDKVSHSFRTKTRRTSIRNESSPPVSKRTKTIPSNANA